MSQATAGKIVALAVGVGAALWALAQLMKMVAKTRLRPTPPCPNLQCDGAMVLRGDRCVCSKCGLYRIDGVN